ncbi:hypothetical protein KVV02_005035 [Mortierella alpina]|uniref:Methyltransferase domain-containing protein n=1 Tax=Mortierella alpina TaxID=64518 RepID=A0A9P8CUA0_MORAP|nr:hypothetical protein KVV02_005035 [Mortierella alpina]
MGNSLCCQNDLGEVPQDMHDSLPNGNKGAHKHKHHQSTLSAATSPLDPTHQHQHHQHHHKQVTSDKSLGPTHLAKKKTGERRSNGIHTRSDTVSGGAADTRSSDPRHKQHEKASLFKTLDKQPRNNNNNNNCRFAADSAATSFNSQSLFSIERQMERDNISPDFQWLEGRRYHNTPGASYLLPNDIDELQLQVRKKVVSWIRRSVRDRDLVSVLIPPPFISICATLWFVIPLQHFILRYAIQGNYKAPLDKSKVRAILDVGCGPGTWTMEMANEFPDATLTGIDMSAVFPTTIIPGNCRFLQHNILNRFPFPDNTFDFVYQRLLIAGLTPDDWSRVLSELERVTKPGGWIELVEVDGVGGNNGPYTAKIWSWVDRALATRGVNCQIGREPGLVPLMEKAQITNIKQDALRLPTGHHGGKIGVLLKENEHSFWNAITPMIIHGAGIDQEEYEEAIRISAVEVEEYKSYHIFYVVTGQKRVSSSSHPNS